MCKLGKKWKRNAKQRPVFSWVCVLAKLLSSHVSTHFPRPIHRPQVLSEPVRWDQYLHNVPVTGRGASESLSSVVEILNMWSKAA